MPRFNPYKIFYGIHIPDAVLTLDISAGAKLCYGVLTRIAGKKGVCWPYQETIGKDLGVSERQVTRYIEELVEKKLIESERVGLGRPNRYYFLDDKLIVPPDPLVPEDDPLYEPPDEYEREANKRVDVHVVSEQTHASSVLEENHRRESRSPAGLGESADSPRSLSQSPCISSSQSSESVTGTVSLAVEEKKNGASAFFGEPTSQQFPSRQTAKISKISNYPNKDGTLSGSLFGELSPNNPDSHENGHGKRRNGHRKVPDASPQSWRDETFEQFWEVVWLKKGKDEARRSWGRLATRTQAEQVIQAAIDQRELIVRHAMLFGHSLLRVSTWLNEGRYKDDLEHLRSELQIGTIDKRSLNAVSNVTSAIERFKERHGQ